MRVVDINRIGQSTLAADEAWVVDPTDRRAVGPAVGNERGRDGSPPSIGSRSQLVVRPGPLGDLEARMTRSLDTGGPRAVRLCPGPSEHDYPLEPWVLSPLPEYCAREDVAVLVDPGSSSGRYPWAEIVRLAREYPSLVVVALAAPLAGPTAARALDAAPNLVLETSALDDGAETDVRHLVSTAGSHRLAYGSGDRAIAAPAVAACLPEDATPAVMAGTADLIGLGGWGQAYL